MVQLSLLSTNSALRSGADLWVLPSLNQSRWTQIIDWYLNHQISQSYLRKPQRPGENLRNICEQEQVAAESFQQQKESPLLIPSTNQLPCQYVVELRSQSDFLNWVHEGLKIWVQLQAPRLRFFLPKNHTPQSVQQALQSFKIESKFAPIEVIPDTDN